MTSNSYFSSLPPATKYIIVVNVVVLLLDYALQRFGIQLTAIAGMFAFNSPYFRFWQPLTYMFMHGGFWHLFCNMFAVFMFAPVLERRWGTQRFLIYYLVSGFGAALTQQLVWALTGVSGITVGASGAVFGILFAFGWLYPDVEMFLMFIPIPIRARVFVLLYALFELWQGISPHAGDNVAHFAHLGGFLFGWLLLLYWNRKGYTGAQAGVSSSQTADKLRRWWNELVSKFRSRKQESQGKFRNYHYKDPISDATVEPERTDDAEEQKVNAILDKIKHSGYSSLTDEEKDQLFKSNKK